MSYFFSQRYRHGVMGLLLSMGAPVYPAPPNTAPQPIDIEADAVELDDGKQQSTYTGKVVIRQGDLHLWAEQVVVKHQPSRQPSRIVATGTPVRYRQDAIEANKVVTAQSLRMEYDATTQEILLIDQALLTQGKDNFSSDRILYDRSKAVVKAGANAQGHQRVHISITPDSKPGKTK